MNQGKFIRLLIVALPTGLFILGFGAMMQSTMQGPESIIDPNEKIRLEAASLHRKPVNQADLEQYLNVLCVKIGERNLQVPAALEQTAIWLESTLGSGNIGYPITRQVYEVNGKTVRNLIAELPGTSKRDEIVVIGAHYDTVPNCPGANDNGTGVAGMLALARAFAGEQQERTLRFVAFVNEEQPYFQTEDMGSVRYAKKCRMEGDRIVAMLSLDSIGYFTDEPGSQSVPEGLDNEFPDTGNFLAFVGDSNSRFIVDSAKASFANSSGTPVVGGVFPGSVQGVGWSDHWSFWQEEFPAVMVTDTAPFRYSHYHKPTDTVDRLDLTRLEDVVSGLKQVVTVWANPSGR
ncbi:M20/M25/M40 family metallo-hydrolase [Verrucomicrobiales bacterium]|nr:M20/M25/M40 family metallo-hydrolase [Verrucomicrobiales bacterium]MDA7926496.1 M20/M25/M40 family metallo-hydrolase [Verrucomicrobiales bacterium]